MDFREKISEKLTAERKKVAMEFLAPPLPETEDKLLSALENLREILKLQVSCAKDPKIYDLRKNQLEKINEQLAKMNKQ